ncbi:Abi-like protein [Rhizobiales bacterium GAS113]|nr:Abi-like protein [Rhizobiales bacterium GAS113]
MIRVVIQTLSVERFGTYRLAGGHDDARAIALYVWNAQLGEAFHTPIQAVEVGLRNCINHALAAKFGQDWWRERKFRKLLDRERLADLDMVQRRIGRRGLPLVTSQIVAGLSFGFWVGMLHARYNPDIWSGQLRASLPHLPATENRHSLFQKAGAIAFLRNRISHHEPIFKRDILADFRDIMNLIKWICPSTETWIRPHCRVPELARQKP